RAAGPRPRRCSAGGCGGAGVCARAAGLNDVPDAMTQSLALAQAGRIPEAIAALEAALGSQPENAAAHALLGTLFHASGRTAEALRALRRAHELAPADARIVYQLGALLASAGDVGRGVPLMRRAV